MKTPAICGMLNLVTAPAAFMVPGPSTMADLPKCQVVDLSPLVARIAKCGRESMILNLRKLSARALTLLVTIGVAGHVQAADFQAIDVPAGYSGVVASYVSDDGGTVVGTVQGGSSPQRAFVWTAGAMQIIDGLPGDYISQGRRVSADGSTVLGFSCGLDCRGFAWTMAGGVQPMALPGHSSSYVTGVSADGTTIVGYSWGPGLSTGFVWTASTGLEAINPVPGDVEVFLNDVSVDGEVIAGLFCGSGGCRAFSWSRKDGTRVIEPLPDDSTTVANAISADGTAVIGKSYGSVGIMRGFLWKADQGIVPIEPLLGDTSIHPTAVSGNGSTVVGYSCGTGLCRGFMWTPSSGTQLLLLPGDTRGSATGVSANGTSVVGYSFGTGEQRGFIWTKAKSIQPLTPSGVAHDISANGTTVVGYACDSVQCPGAIWQIDVDPAELLVQLRADVSGIGPGSSLWDKIGLAQDYYSNAEITSTCTVLTDFTKQVRALASKKTLDLETASTLISDANYIKQEIGCN